MRSQQRSARTGNTKAMPKTNCTSCASACRPSGTRPKSQALSSFNASRCCGRWSAMSVRPSARRSLQRYHHRGGWRPRMTLRWKGWSSSGIMRSRDFVCLFGGPRGWRFGGKDVCTKLDGLKGIFWDTNYVRCTDRYKLGWDVFSSFTQHHKINLPASLGGLTW